MITEKEFIETALKNPELKTYRNNYLERLEAMHNGQCPPIAFQVEGIEEKEDHPCENIEKWVNSAFQKIALQADKTLDNTVFRPLAIRYNPYGVHFVDQFFGAEIFWTPESKQWNNKCLSSEVGKLSFPDIENNPIWKQCKRAVDEYLKYDQEIVYYALPTLSSASNIAVNLYGEEFLAALCVEPEKAAHDIEIITNTIIYIHKWYMEHIPANKMQHSIPTRRAHPPGYGQICGCTTQLISPECYKKFFIEKDDAVLSLYPKGGLIHLCGAHTQHLDAWKELKSLKAIQINGGANKDFEKYYAELRKDQVLYLNPNKDMTAAHAMRLTGGDRLVIMGSYLK